jgi:putative toxin-antitoxin system antitoxin component (TIGR02293 family)
MTRLDLVIEALGGRGVMERSEKLRQKKAAGRDEDLLIERVRSGLPYSGIEAIQTRFGIAQNELLKILHLPYRTLARRKEAGRLSADESDRLVRLGRICGQAEEVLGNPARAGRWLREPNPALGDTPPLRWLDTDLGAREVELLLSRIAHGVYS